MVGPEQGDSSGDSDVTHHAFWGWLQGMPVDVSSPQIQHTQCVQLGLKKVKAGHGLWFFQANPSSTLIGRDQSQGRGRSQAAVDRPATPPFSGHIS